MIVNVTDVHLQSGHGQDTYSMAGFMVVVEQQSSLSPGAVAGLIIGLLVALGLVLASVAVMVIVM